MWWNYVVRQEETRSELYIDAPEAAENKPLFDALYNHREAVEEAFGGPLCWQRLDEKRACRISLTVPGGWLDETTWPGAIEKAVDAMGRLYGALAPRVEEFRNQ
jgi:hypothetical protein